MIKTTKRKIYLLINIVFTIVISVFNTFYQYNNFNYVLKCFTCGGFALLSVINFTYFIKSKVKATEIYVPLFMMLGSIFCFAGDAMLHEIFVFGVALFALGHIFFIVSYCFLKRLNWLDLIIGGSIGVFAVLMVLLVPYFTFEEVVMQIAVAFYALILSMMLGKAISTFIKEKNKMNLLILVGASLFFFSDLMLLFGMFSPASNVVNHLCMATYVPANIIFAFSILYFFVKKEDTL